MLRNCTLFLTLFVLIVLCLAMSKPIDVQGTPAMTYDVLTTTHQMTFPLILNSYDSNRLTYSPGDEAQPAISPDGQSVIFLGEEAGVWDIYRMSMKGGTAVSLTETPATEETPIFAPDGTTFAFASDITGDWDIYLMGLGTPVIIPVIISPGTSELHPSFTPDGTGLVFSSDREAGNWDIYTTTIGSSVWNRLTRDPAVDRFPSFSVDGSMIVFRGERDGNSELYVMDADGSNLRRLTTMPSFEGYPTFTPDNSGIVFISDYSEGRRAYVINLAGQGLRDLDSRPDWQVTTPRLSPDGRWLIYAGGPLGSPRDLYKRAFTSPLYAMGEKGKAGLGGRCEWEEGTLVYGLIEAWRATQDADYLRWAMDWITACMAEKEEFTHINDSMLGYVALVVYEATGEPAYLAFAERVADYVLTTAPRTSDGTFSHDEHRVWADTLLGAVPFLMTMGEVKDDPLYTDEAVEQLVRHTQHLQDPETGLYYHAWDEASLSSPLGKAYWARGNGWVLLADVTVLSSLPSSHPAYTSVLTAMQAHAAGLAPLQDASGLWHTVVSRPDFYLETSGSALIGYGLQRAVQEGWLDEQTYGPVARRAILGTWEQVLADGTVLNVSAPTWPMLEDEYNERPYDVLQLYGQGAALLLGSSNVP
ncbi:MAG: glycoside hydrolase family 88 protein [Anaerolineae bacterium]|nr:glycoside hydrolase family 88 protein [Anaerolineae bacterium]